MSDSDSNPTAPQTGASKKPNFKLDILPPSSTYLQHQLQNSAPQQPASESILVNDIRKMSLDGGGKSRGTTLNPPPNNNGVHHKQPSMHAHFLVNDIVGHQGTARSRSASGSDRGSDSDFTRSSIIESISNRGESSSSSSGGVGPAVTSTANTSGITGGTNTAGTASTGIGGLPTTISNDSIPTSNSNQSNTTSSTSNSDPRLPQDDGKVHILIGATGSVSTGKLRQIILKLEEIYTKPKVSVQVILTKAAEKFVSRGEIPSNIRIWRDSDEWANWRGRSDAVVHIELRRWADILVVAPLSANTLGKIAIGLCDNLLTNVIRAWNTQYPILIAPAMSSYAYNHPATKRHIKTIKEEMKWIETLKPVEKVVGSYGDIGMGGMMDWNEIVDKTVMKLGGYPNNGDEDDDDDDDESAIRLKDGDDDDDEDDDEDDDDNDDSNSFSNDEKSSNSRNHKNPIGSDDHKRNQSVSSF